MPHKNIVQFLNAFILFFFGVMIFVPRLVPVSEYILLSSHSYDSLRPSTDFLIFDVAPTSCQSPPKHALVTRFDMNAF